MWTNKYMDIKWIYAFWINRLPEREKEWAKRVAEDVQKFLRLCRRAIKIKSSRKVIRKNRRHTHSHTQTTTKNCFVVLFRIFAHFLRICFRVMRRDFCFVLLLDEVQILAVGFFLSPSPLCLFDVYIFIACNAMSQWLLCWRFFRVSLTHYSCDSASTPHTHKCRRSTEKKITCNFFPFPLGNITIFFSVYRTSVPHNTNLKCITNVPHCVGCVCHRAARWKCLDTLHAWISWYTHWAELLDNNT